MSLKHQPFVYSLASTCLELCFNYKNPFYRRILIVFFFGKYINHAIEKHLLHFFVTKLMPDVMVHLLQRKKLIHIYVMVYLQFSTKLMPDVIDIYYGAQN